MAKVTKSLRARWERQLAQDIAERDVDQSGRLRHPDSVAEMDESIAEMRRLLALPIGAEF